MIVKKIHTSKVLFWLFVLIVFVLSVIPAVGLHQAFNSADKVMHFSAFFLLSFLMLSAYKFSRPILASLLLLTAFGLGIELIQNFVPHHRFTFDDIAANFAGVLVGAVFSRITV